MADYDVAINVPAGYDVLATGAQGGDGHWRASAVRDFAASVGHFNIADADVNGVHLVVGVDSSVDEDPHRDLDLLVTALPHYESRLADFPWPSITVAVTPGFHGGIEFPLHIMQGPGSAPRSVVHELAHQWFYSLVGNDQARDPWIDEGLASYLEFIEIGSFEHNASVTIPTAVDGHAGDPMTFWDHHTDDYYAGLYVQTAEAIGHLGGVDRVDCALHQFVARSAYRIATPADFFAAVTPIIPDVEANLASAGIRR